MKTTAESSKAEKESSKTVSRSYDHEVFFAGRDRVSEPFFKPVVIQTSLKMGEKEDPFEREADQIAGKVVSMPDTEVQMKSGDQPVVKNRTDSAKNGDQVPYDISREITSSSGKGHSLPGDTQKEMETKIGADFSNVSIHTGPDAARLSDNLGARAFTAGNDIYFNRGEYQPGSTEGRKLMAHELVHTVQQGGVIRKEETDEESSSEVEILDRVRFEIAQLLIGNLFPWTRILRLFGWSTNGLGIGIQVSYGFGSTVVISGGKDFMAFYDIMDNSFDGNTFPFGTLAFGIEAGANGSLVCGLEIGPTDEAGGDRAGSNYSGSGVSFGASYGVSGGLTISSGIFRGEADWVVYTAGLGPKAGISVGVTKSLDARDLLNKVDEIARKITDILVERFFSSIVFETISGVAITLVELQSMGVRTMEDVASQFGERVFESGANMLGFGLYNELYGPWIPGNWDLSEFDEEYQGSLNHMVNVIWLNFNSKLAEAEMYSQDPESENYGARIIQFVREMERTPIDDLLKVQGMSSNQWDATEHYNTIIDAFVMDFGDEWDSVIVPLLGERNFFDLEHREFISLVTTVGNVSIGDDGDFARDFPLDSY